MGNQSSADTRTASNATGSDRCPVQHEVNIVQPQESSGCPVKHDKPKSADVLGGGCPINHEKPNSEVYNVYSQRIDPTNMMPYNPNQEPRDEQRFPLPQTRVQSTIPKGGTEGTWLYPSEQMFFNALRRKGKGDDVHEGDVSTIVAIHNNMNERAWHQVEHYEKVCHPESTPKLLKFCGRPDKLTPIAWVKNLLGYGAPFDRHDWTIQRSDNTQVRYVIDYYFDDEKATQDQVPELHSATSVRSISMYARPAIDSFESLLDRIKFPVMGLFDKRGPSDLSARNALVEASATTVDAELAPLSTTEVQETFAMIQNSCKQAFQTVRTCKNEFECSAAALGLQLCMGKIICPREAASFTTAFETGDEKDVENALDALNKRLERFQDQSAEAMRVQAEQEAASK